MRKPLAISSAFLNASAPFVSFSKCFLPTIFFAAFSISSIDSAILPKDFAIASLVCLLSNALTLSKSVTIPPMEVAIPVIASAAGLSEPKLIRAFIKCTELEATLYESIAAPTPSNTDST